MRDHHAGRGPRERVQVEGDVALSQWHRKHTPVPITPAFFILTWLSLRSATSSVAPSSASQSSLSAFRDPSQDGLSPSSSAATCSAINTVQRTSWHLAQGSSSSWLCPKVAANRSRRTCMISRAKASPLRCITPTMSVHVLFYLFFEMLLRATLWIVDCGLCPLVV